MTRKRREHTSPKKVSNPAEHKGINQSTAGEWQRTKDTAEAVRGKTTSDF